MSRLIHNPKSPLVLALALVGLSLAVSSLSPVHAADTVGAKWEHFCEESTAAKTPGKGTATLNDNMNKRGAEGWELVSTNIIPRGMSYKVMTCYKRPKS